MLKGTQPAVHSKLLSLYLIAAIIILCSIAACGSGGIVVGDNNGDNRNNSTVIREIESEDQIKPVTGEQVDTTPGFNPMCPIGGFNFNDGAKVKNEWKPCSERLCTLVILFDAEFDVKFEKVEVIRLDGQVESLMYSDKGNGGRQHWRGELSGEFYTGELRAFYDNQECSATIDKPSERQG